MVTQALSLYSDDDRRRSVLQHRDILTAIANGDAELAESAMRSHILAARYTARGLGDVPEPDPIRRRARRGRSRCSERRRTPRRETALPSVTVRVEAGRAQRYWPPGAARG